MKSFLSSTQAALLIRDDTEVVMDVPVQWLLPVPESGEVSRELIYPEPTCTPSLTETMLMVQCSMMECEQCRNVE